MAAHSPWCFPMETYGKLPSKQPTCCLSRRIGIWQNQVFGPRTGENAGSGKHFMPGRHGRPSTTASPWLPGSHPGVSFTSHVWISKLSRNHPKSWNLKRSDYYKVVPPQWCFLVYKPYKYRYTYIYNIYIYQHISTIYHKYGWYVLFLWIRRPSEVPFVSFPRLETSFLAGLALSEALWVCAYGHRCLPSGKPLNIVENCL